MLPLEAISFWELTEFTGNEASEILSNFDVYGRVLTAVVPPEEEETWVACVGWK